MALRSGTLSSKDVLVKLAKFISMRWRELTLKLSINDR